MINFTLIYFIIIINMSLITKTLVSNSNNYDNYHHLIKSWLFDNINFNGNISLDYKMRIRKDLLHLIPYLFNKKIIFKYLDTFQQNNKLLADKIRNQVINFYGEIDKISCIGGESFCYSIVDDNIRNSHFYSNNICLCEESDFNAKIYSKKIISKCINYNKNKKLELYSTIIINLSKLNINLLNTINSNVNVNTIIIINCNHNDFWKKIKVLNRFKLIKRKKFIGDEYFMTVNLLVC